MVVNEQYRQLRALCVQQFDASTFSERGRLVPHIGKPGVNPAFSRSTILGGVATTVTRLRSRFDAGLDFHNCISFP